MEQTADEVSGPASRFEDSRPEFAYGAEYLENFSDQRGRSLKVPQLSAQFSLQFVYIPMIVGKGNSGSVESVWRQILDQRNRSELLTTDTELSAIAAAANTGLNNMPKKG